MGMLPLRGMPVTQHGGRSGRGGSVSPPFPFSERWGERRGAVMAEWCSSVRPLAVETLGERYHRYRLSDPAAEEAMARSLRQYGQSSPVVVCLREGRPELLD